MALERSHLLNSRLQPERVFLFQILSFQMELDNFIGRVRFPTDAFEIGAGVKVKKASAFDKLCLCPR